MSDYLTVHYDYSPAEHVQALEETPYRRWLKKWWVPGSIALIAGGRISTHSMVDDHTGCRI
jgi:hypothetical protein